MRISRKVWIATALIALLGLLYFVVLTVAAGQITRLLPGAVAEAIGGRDADRYDVHVSDVDLSLLLNGLTVRDLTVSIDSSAVGATVEPALVQAAHLGSLRVAGLRILPLLRGKGIYVSSIDLEGPTVSLYFPEQGERSEIPEGGEGRSEVDVRPTEFRPPRTNLRRVRIQSGSIDLTRFTDRGMLTSLLRDLDLTLTEIEIDSVTFANPVQALANSRVTIAFDTVYHVLDDSLYFVAATDVRADSRDSVVEIGSVGFTPTLEAAPFFGRLPKRADRLNVRAGPIRIEGLDFANYIRDEAVGVRLVRVDSLDLQVYSDIALDWGPKALPCRYHMGFAGIPIPFRIDTVRLVDGSIRYSELAKGSESPGQLEFDGVNGTVVNLTNDPERMTATTPAIAQLGARLYGAGPVAATIRYPLLSSTLDFDVEASLGAMSLVPANRFATNVTGVEVKEGQLDSLWVGFESRDGKATGRIHMRYRDLDFRIIDRNTGKEMAWHSVLGFLGNVALRSSNPGKPEDEPRDGRIDYTCAEDDIVFFEYLVGAMVSGIKRVVLII
jgi:hypothetical protein